MTVGFIDNTEYNLDLFLMHPNCIGSQEDKLDIYREIYESLIKYSFNIGKNLLSINNNMISFDVNLDEIRELYNFYDAVSTILNSKYCIIKETYGTLEHKWWIVKILSYERTNENSYKFKGEIDTVRTYPQNNKVFKLYDEYNGYPEVSNDNLSLINPVYNKTYEMLDPDNFTVVAIVKGDLLYQGTTPGNKEYIGLSYFSETTSVNIFSKFNDQLYSSSYLINFGHAGVGKLADSCDCFRRYINFIQDIGAGEQSIVRNIVTAYIIPKDLVALVNVYAMFDRGGTTQQGELRYNGYSDINLQYEQSGEQILETVGRVCILQSKNNYIYYDNKIDLLASLKSLAKDYYGSDNYYSKNYCKIIIDTYETKYELDYELIESLISGGTTCKIKLEPVFNGGQLSYYISFQGNQGVELFKNFRLVGKSFCEMPISTLGVERFLNNDYKTMTYKTIVSSLASGANAVAGAGTIKQSYENSNIGGIGAGVGGIVGSLASIANNFKTLEFNKQMGISQPVELGTVSNLFMGLTTGLFSITYYIAHEEEIAIWKNINDYYNIKAEQFLSNDENLDFSKNDIIQSHLTRNQFIYHKGQNNSSNSKLSEILNNGIFYICFSRNLITTDTNYTNIKRAIKLLPIDGYSTII